MGHPMDAEIDRELREKAEADAERRDKETCAYTVRRMIEERDAAREKALADVLRILRMRRADGVFPVQSDLIPIVRALDDRIEDAVPGPYWW